MAKRRKGLSLDDKRTTILGIYHEKLDHYWSCICNIRCTYYIYLRISIRREPLNLKEIESFGAKAVSALVQSAHG